MPVEQADFSDGSNAAESEADGFVSVWNGLSNQVSDDRLPAGK